MTLSAHERLMQSADAVARDLAPALVNWQRQQGRHHLPWQGTRDPYRVWLSEIMLQQTQVSTVLGYYDRFLARFPDVAALAAAPLDEVLTLWSGLGYYSRARNLHRCAQAVMDLHGGVFPGDALSLQSLPGIGPSTASAIAAFCFHERISIMDGNVKRVLGRVLAWGEDLAVAAHERALWQAAAVLVPTQAQDMPSYTQGLMDLGATVCTLRKPSCLVCPWAVVCQGRLSGAPENFPVKTRKLKRSQRENWWLWLEHDGHVWLTQRPETGVWAGLWTLPLLDDEASVDRLVVGWDVRSVEIQPAIKHVLTHLDWHLHPRRVALSVRPELASLPGVDGALPGRGEAAVHGRWVAVDRLAEWGLPAPLRRLLP